MDNIQNDTILYKYNSYNEFKNKRIKIEHHTHNVIDTSNSHNNTVMTEIIDLTQDDITPVKYWKIYKASNKKEHKQLAQKLRYDKLLELCGNSESLLQIYKLIDCNQYVNVGENDIIFYNRNNPTEYKIKIVNHGQPIYQIFM